MICRSPVYDAGNSFPGISRMRNTFCQLGIQIPIGIEYISRTAEQKLLALARQFRAVTIVGPRQSGKTTLAHRLFADKAYVSLENPDQLRFALEDPRGFLAQCTKYLQLGTTDRPAGRYGLLCRRTCATA